MDQERDTTNNAKRSRRERYRPEKSPSGGRPGRGSEPNAPSYGGDFQEIPDPAAARIDPAAESLPTLFELPDRTPERLQQKRDTGQMSIHDAHSGPPASHVDPPSGNQGHRRDSGPISPDGTDSVMPDENAQRSASEQTGKGPMGDPTKFSEEPRVAAQRDDSMSWASAKASWAARSAIVMLVLLMVTLAFLFGRGSNKTGTSDDRSQLTDADAEDLGDAIVVITEDVSTEQVNPPSLDTPPSYVVEAPAPTGTLGEPSASLPAEIDVALDDNPPASAASDNPILPQSFESSQSVVAFRNTETPGGDPTAVSDPLPAGMKDRLRLEDGLRYSDTPYAIGNFLEILKAWENSEQQ